MGPNDIARQFASLLLLRLQPVEINQSGKVIFHRLGKLLRKTDIRQTQLRRFGVCLSQLSPHARFEGIEPQSESR
jgi:hypothetical protein